MAEKTISQLVGPAPLWMRALQAHAQAAGMNWLERNLILDRYQHPGSSLDERAGRLGVTVAELHQAAEGARQKARVAE